MNHKGEPYRTCKGCGVKTIEWKKASDWKGIENGNYCIACWGEWRMGAGKTFNLGRRSSISIQSVRHNTIRQSANFRFTGFNSSKSKSREKRLQEINRKPFKASERSGKR